MSFVALFRPFQLLSACLSRLLPSRLTAASSSLLASWHEREVVPFLSITAVILAALLANFCIVLPHVQPLSLSIAFYVLGSLLAPLTFAFLVLLREVDPGVLEPSSSPPSPRTQQLLDSHQHWYISPKRYARQHPRIEGTASYTPVLSNDSTALARHPGDADDSDDDEREAGGALVVQDWCFGCQIWRPPHAGHCRHCECCVQRFDHHCFVLGACVGRLNTLFFLAFLAAAGASGVLAASASIVMLLQRAPFDESSASDPLVWLGGLLACASLYIGSALLFLLYHVHLLCRNTTTREQHRSSHTVLPAHLAVRAGGSAGGGRRRWSEAWRDVVWPPGRRWRQAWVVQGRSERRRLMEARWRRESSERGALQQSQQQRNERAEERSEDSVGSQERLWKEEDGDEHEMKEQAVLVDEGDEDEAESTVMPMSVFLRGDG